MNLPSRQWYDRSSERWFPICQYYVDSYQAFPSVIETDEKEDISTKFVTWLKKNYKLVEMFYMTNITKTDEDLKYVMYNIPSIKVILQLSYNKAISPEAGEYGYEDVIQKNPSSISIYYSEYESVKEIIKAIQKNYLKRKENRISLIIQGRTGLDSRRFKIKIDDIDIGMNYGEDFVPVYKNIMKKLSTDYSKGLVLFHGNPGTGKTSLLKYIAKNLKKEILFIPPHMTESITAPGFIPFLMDHSNSILIIEDAERVIASRDSSGDNAGVSNILNLSDGILGDCLNIQIIATFNTKKDRIDEALMRKGRLIASHEFKELPKDNANILLKHLGKDSVATRPMTLTEIYNIDEIEYKDKNSNAQIGFEYKNKITNE